MSAQNSMAIHPIVRHLSLHQRGGVKEGLDNRLTTAVPKDMALVRLKMEKREVNNDRK